MRRVFTASGIGTFLLGVALALGFTMSAQTISRAMVRMRQANTINVKGFAAETIESDFATWECGIAARAASLPDAYGRLEKATGLVQQFLVKSGVKENEIILLPASTSIKYERDKPNVIELYELCCLIRVSSTALENVDKVSKGVTALIKEDVEVASGRPAYLSSKIDEIKLDLLARATENAYKRAEILAGKCGGKVGPLCSASQGVFQITPVHSTEVSGEGVYDTSTIKKRVTAVVTLQFLTGKPEG